MPERSWSRPQSRKLVEASYPVSTAVFDSLKARVEALERALAESGGVTGEPKEALEALEDRLSDAIENAMWAHEALKNDSICTCGVRNNMDGDVLTSHRVSEVVEAASAVLAQHFVEWHNRMASKGAPE